MQGVGAGQHATRLGRSVYSGRVMELLREAIIDGALAANTPLVEHALASELAVSRGPVRSALHALEGEGLVKMLPNGRTVVVGFDSRSLEDLFAVRYELETTATRWGIELGTDAVGLREAFAAIEAEGGSTSRLVDFDIAFHRALVEFSGSRFLLQAWLALAPSIHTVITIGNRRLATRDPELHYERIVAAHRPLIEAVTDHNTDRAMALLTEQFKLTRSLFSANARATEGQL